MNETALRLARLLFDQPLIQNQFRSAFVEAMIEPHLVNAGWRYVGANWSGWDFEHEFGTRLELKQSAAWQTRDPAKQAASGLPPKPGPGIFDIAPRTGWFDEAGAVWRKEPGRPAHVYVLAWHRYYGDAADHRDPNQWEFFVLPTSALPLRMTICVRQVRAINNGLAGSFVGPERCAQALAPFACCSRNKRIPEIPADRIIWAGLRVNFGPPLRRNIGILDR